MRLPIIAILASALLLSACGDTGGGEKNGVITKLATSGVFCKTNEMEIVRGGLSGGSGVNGSSFDVTIEDPALLKIAQDAITTGAEIQIHYRTEFMTFCRSDSSDHFLTSIKIIRPGTAGMTVDQIGKALAAPGAQAAAPAGQVTIPAAQYQQMIDNQTKSIDQNERLVKVVEAMAAHR